MLAVSRTIHTSTTRLSAPSLFCCSMYLRARGWRVSGARGKREGAAAPDVFEDRGKGGHADASTDEDRDCVRVGTSELRCEGRSPMRTETRAPSALKTSCAGAP